MKPLLISLALLLVACPREGYRSYFTNVTAYRYDLKKAKTTPKGVRYFAPVKDDTIEFRVKLDRLTEELRVCLLSKNPKWVVRTDWFVVLVPPDWYVSTCSGQQLVPSVPDCRICQNQKKLPLPDKCCGLRKPTPACPCVCNMRAVVQVGRPLPAIVATPNLLLFKAELARLVTNVNFVWGVPNIRKCL